MKFPARGLWLGVVVLFLGCQQAEIESPTSGYITIASSESIAPIIRKEAEEFQRLYQKAKITTTVSSSREVIMQLLRGDVKTVFIPRGLNEEEKKVAEEYNIRVDTYRLALDAVAIIVHPENPVGQLNLEEVGAIYRGKITNWREVKGRAMPILPVALSRNTATSELVLKKAVKDTVFTRSTYVCPSSAQMLETVAQRQDAIGFVGLAWLSDRGSSPQKVKVLEIADEGTSTFVAPYQAAIYRGDYPLQRSLYALTSERGLGLAAGFISFVTSAQGQKVVLDSGLVPVTMPVKLVKFRQ